MVSLRDVLSLGMSGGEVKPELREWLGPGAAQFCCIAAIVDHRDDSLAVYYNESCLILFFSSDYQERMEHGRGALQPLNLFLFLESANLFPFVHVSFFFFFDVPNTTFSTQFYETMISTQRYWDKNEAWVFCTLALWSVQEQRHYYISTWNPSNFLQPKRGRNEEK